MPKAQPPKEKPAEFSMPCSDDRLATTPRRVFAAEHPWPLHDAAATRQLEVAALAATAPLALMARAGQATARLALAVAPHARRVVVLVGPGNNGGDALIAGLHLRRRGLDVKAWVRADPDRLPADAADAWRQAREAGLPLLREDAELELAQADLLIDGLLGLGAARAPDEALAHLIAKANASGRPVLAIDLPSGLAPDQGRVLGEQAIRARWTLALLTLKPGLFTAQGRDHAGEVWFDALGWSATEGLPAPSAWLGAARSAPSPGLADRRHAQHKGSFGDLVVVGGGPGMQGALRLAGAAALHAGAGRVYLCPLDSEAATAPDPELMRLPLSRLADAQRLRTATVVCGCGGGEAVGDVLPGVLEHAGRLLLDADALNAVAADAGLAAALRERAARGGSTVLTPHPLEAARLLRTTTAEVQQDRLAAAQRLADETAAVVVLKGSGSVVAAAARTPWINASGNAALATPGSGDVLAGYLGGLWAQAPTQTPPRTDDAAWDAARIAVWLHGRAADLARQAHPRHAKLPLVAGGLADAMGAALDLASGAPLRA